LHVDLLVDQYSDLRHDYTVACC